MQTHLRRPGLAIRVAKPMDLQRARAAIQARRSGRPHPSTRSSDALRRHVDAIARGEASDSPAVKQGIGPR
jgi:hypothetical protein